MELEWIIKKLRISGSGTKQEVLNALENANADELLELGVSCLKKVIKPVVDEIVKVCDSEDLKQKIKEYMDMLHSEHNLETN